MTKPQKTRTPRPLGFGRVVLLGLLCLSIAETAACYIFAPDLFNQIADSVHEKTSAIVIEGGKKLSVFAADARTQLAALHERIQRASAQGTQVQTVEDSQSTSSGDMNGAQDNTIIQHDGYYVNPATGDTVLTGGNVDLLFYNQTAPAWKDQLYGTDKIGTHGCGPTVLSMIISSLTKYRVDPKMMSDRAVENGYYASGDGSYHSLIPGTARAYGLDVTSCADRTVSGLKQELMSGKLLVVLMRPGHFTDSGHFMILRGVDASGNFLIADPQSFDNSIKSWDPNIIVNELASHDADGGPVWAIGSGKTI